MSATVLMATLHSLSPFYDAWRIPLNNSIGHLHGVAFADFAAMFDGQSDYTVDGIHPNDSGYAQMRDLINQAL